MKKILLAMAVVVPFLALSAPVQTFAACSYAYEVRTNYDEDYYRVSKMYQALKAWRDYNYSSAAYKAPKQVYKTVRQAYKAPQKDWYEVDSSQNYRYDRDSQSWYEITTKSYWTEEDSWNYFNRDYNTSSWRTSYRATKPVQYKYNHDDYNYNNDDYDYNYNYNYNYNVNYNYDRDNNDDWNWNRNYNNVNWNNRTYDYNRNRNNSRNYRFNDSRFIGG